MKANVYKIVLMVTDFEQMGEESVCQILEQHKHLSPSVVESQERTVEWDDDHPLNKRGTWRGAFDELFRDPPPTPCDCGGKGCPVCAPTEDGPGQPEAEGNTKGSL